MKLLAIWILMSAVTYWHVMISNFGKNVFQHNLDVEGSCRETIVVFCVAFAIFWPLWWFLMFPICICIGRKELPHANHVRRAGEPGSAAMKETRKEAATGASNVKEMREALEKLLTHFMCDVALLNDRFTPLFTIINHALAAQPRNCDVGDSCLQTLRFEEFCRNWQSPLGACKSECPLVDEQDMCHCFAKWSQMPFESEKPVKEECGRAENTAKLRKTIEKMSTWAADDCEGCVWERERMAKAAFSEAPRNCDRFETADEAMPAFIDECLGGEKVEFGDAEWTDAFNWLFEKAQKQEVRQ